MAAMMVMAMMMPTAVPVCGEMMLYSVFSSIDTLPLTEALLFPIFSSSLDVLEPMVEMVGLAACLTVSLSTVLESLSFSVSVSCPVSVVQVGTSCYDFKVGVSSLDWKALSQGSSIQLRVAWLSFWYFFCVWNNSFLLSLVQVVIW